MKVLHIHDQAGVACILAKYQRINGMKSKVLSSYRTDKYGIFKYYKDYVDIVEQNNFVETCISEAKNADIIHIHSLEELVVKIRKRLGNSKKIILHYHGTDLRGRKDQNFLNIGNIKTKIILLAYKIIKRLRLLQMGYYRSLQVESQKLSNNILVSTPDLLSLLPNANYLPNPIDVEHFSKDNISKNKLNNTALTIKTESGDIEKTLKYLEENNINLKIDIFDRTKTPLLHEEIPNLLKRYDIYVDIRIVNGKLLENYSKTALESLACGLKVLNYKLEYVYKLPEVHNPINVINKLQKIYNQI